ncbi:hypothetical protein ACJMK2_040039 [Sinanodonta woodiana]|uniref:Golgin subfamily A conserved domain-containing protein n=1 Tax=Sinanodonta woodiana TaxID=1069815 RepID=A0ABD3WDS5_SINWO
MADSAKRDKIAAARKKLKKFQKAGGRSASKSRESTSSPKPKASKTSSNNSDYSDEMNTVTHISSHEYNEHICSDNEELAIHSESQAHIPTPGNIDGIPEETIRTTASTESLQQLSRQINGLLAETDAVIDDRENSSVAELERRNRELAALLERHSQANEQLNIQVQQLREHTHAVHQQLEKERELFTDRLKKEVGPLKEQLQVHIQTIGILVAEKTELQSHLSQSQKIADERFNEIEELSGRLKASRQRLGELERSLSTSVNSGQQFEKSSKDSAKEVDRLKLELYKSNKSLEELKQQTSELQEKLHSKSIESANLQQTASDLKGRLEMAEVYAQQLSNQNEHSQESLQIVEQLQKERDQLSSQVHQLSEILQQVTAERDQLSSQYKDYMEQLQYQNSQLSQQISTLTEEREQLINRQHALESSVQKLQQQIEESDSQKTEFEESVKSSTLQESRRLQEEYDELHHRHEAQIRDNTQLSRLLEEKEERISDLESRIEQMGEEAGDKTQLLESIQSDKTALSRALTQNRELKVQLAELQNGFVKLSNDNMELLTKLQTEEHSSKELMASLARQEDEIKKDREALALKEIEINKLQQTTHDAMKEKLQREQIQDRLRHFEAQAQLVDTLQKELQSAQDMVDALTTQNSELRTMLIKATEPKKSDQQEENSHREDVIDSLQATITQLESERNQMFQNLKEQRNLSDQLGIKIADLQEELVQASTPSSSEKISRREYEQVKQAMEMIQDKYTRVMRDKAELSDKAEQLEHIVLQLQGETDTIGEYISLYHHQRALLQQREIQKNEYIAQLARDREQMQDKLGELQVLVMQLMGEKKILHSYQKESQRPASPDSFMIQPHLHKHSHAHAHSHMANGHKHCKDEEWPDYTSSESDVESEVEAIVGGKEHDAYFESPDSTDNTEHENIIQATKEAPATHEVKDSTANKILNLLSEIGHSNLVDRSGFAENNFHPCKFCRGSLQVL